MEMVKGGAVGAEGRILTSSVYVTRPTLASVKRENDLHTNVTITLMQALHGFKMAIKHIDGHEGITTVQLKKNKGEGKPTLLNAKKRGDL
ncbi:dnaJ protein ERDJ3B-like [Actinidia eriantha]|uniref:dnaJ protein ERDJ3B-like n=1 Tax=Actinidia eriantha TaxID=165200 RepID=UPI0025883BB9|nr:dnaJ protein ERDJ3B-like [Actinidia eriantha]